MSDPEFITDGFDIRQRESGHGYNWVGETGDIDLTERIVELLNALDGVKNPTAIKVLIDAALVFVDVRKEIGSFRPVTPEQQWLWKPSNNKRETAGISAAHVINLCEALAALGLPVPEVQQSATDTPRKQENE